MMLLTCSLMLSPVALEDERRPTVAPIRAWIIPFDFRVPGDPASRQNEAPSPLRARVTLAFFIGPLKALGTRSRFAGEWFASEGVALFRRRSCDGGWGPMQPVAVAWRLASRRDSLGPEATRKHGLS